MVMMMIIIIVVVVVVACVKNLLLKCTFRSYMLNSSDTASQLYIIAIYVTAYISHILCTYTYDQSPYHIARA
jgi:uncharacterized membrane protein